MTRAERLISILPASIMAKPVEGGSEEEQEEEDVFYWRVRRREVKRVHERAQRSSERGGRMKGGEKRIEGMSED